MTNMHRTSVCKGKEIQRWVSVLILGVALCFVTWLTAPHLTTAWGDVALSALVDVSAILFGVFGIWLGMFYRPDICDARKGKAGSELINTCKHIVSNAKRFDIVFRGMRISAVVLVFSMTVRTLKDPVLQSVPSDDVRHSIKWVVVYLAYWSILLQAYAVIMAIVPMADARRTMHRAKIDAEDTLAL